MTVRLLPRFFVGPGRIPTFYLHSNSTTASSAISSLRL